MLVVRFWPRGYADEPGLSTLRIDPGADVDLAVRVAGGPYAKVYDVVDEDAPRPTPPTAAERDARDLAFRGDWS